MATCFNYVPIPLNYSAWELSRELECKHRSLDTRSGNLGELADSLHWYVGPSFSCVLHYIAGKKRDLGDVVKEGRQLNRGLAC